MTNAEAIKTLRLAQAEVEWEYPMDIAAAIDVAVEALEKAEKYRWHKVKVRPTTDDDGIDKDAYLWFLDCHMPDDGQEIMIARKWRGEYLVDKDECFIDDGYGLDSGLEWFDDVVAWREIEPYEEEDE